MWSQRSPKVDCTSPWGDIGARWNTKDPKGPQKLTLYLHGEQLGHAVTPRNPNVVPKEPQKLTLHLYGETLGDTGRPRIPNVVPKEPKS